jgi:hypothetical protein
VLQLSDHHNGIGSATGARGHTSTTVPSHQSWIAVVSLALLTLGSNLNASTCSRLDRFVQRREVRHSARPGVKTEIRCKQR